MKRREEDGQERKGADGGEGLSFTGAVDQDCEFDADGDAGGTQANGFLRQLRIIVFDDIQ